jgi:hypothetical protein
MKLAFLLAGRIFESIVLPCGTCPAEAFPTRFGELEQALRARLPEAKGYRFHVARKKAGWTIAAHRGIWSGYAVVCTPIYGRDSYNATGFSVRVRPDGLYNHLSVFLLFGLYFLAIGLAWCAQLLGWVQMPGPGMTGILAAVAVILILMIGGTVHGLVLKATGTHGRVMAQLVEIRQLACEVLAAKGTTSP